jgi:hypothetical protein
MLSNLDLLTRALCVALVTAIPRFTCGLFGRIDRFHLFLTTAISNRIESLLRFPGRLRSLVSVGCIVFGTRIIYCRPPAVAAPDRR